MEWMTEAPATRRTSPAELAIKDSANATGSQHEQIKPRQRLWRRTRDHITTSTAARTTEVARRLDFTAGVAVLLCKRDFPVATVSDRLTDSLYMAIARLPPAPEGIAV